MSKHQSQECLPPHKTFPRTTALETSLPSEWIPQTHCEPHPEEPPETTSTLTGCSTAPAHTPISTSTRGVSERIERVCRHLDIKTTFKSRGTLGEALVQTKQPPPTWKKKGVVYQVPCADCESVYIGETGRTLEKRLKEHRGAVKRNDMKNGIAVHAWNTEHRVDWETATVKQVETHYTRRRIIEAIHIKKQKVTSNLDCGRSLNSVWHPLI